MNYYKRMKLSFRGNIPRMEEMDDLDPYKKKTPGDGNGVDMKTPGDEEGWSGLGTRVRGKDFPKNTEEKDRYGLEREKDIPTVDHTLMGENAPLPNDTGVDNGELFDPDSPMSMERVTMDKLENTQSDPLGPHNMHRRLDLFKKVRDRIR